MRKVRMNIATRYFLDSAATERALKHYLPTYGKTRKYLEKDSRVRDMIADAKMIKACELAEKYQGRFLYRLSLIALNVFSPFR